MNRKFVFLFIFCLVALAYWLREREPAPARLRPGPTPTIAPVVRPPAPPPATPLVAQLPSPPKPNPPVAARRAPENEHAPPEGTVPFQVKNGLVVAYGDILMGKPSRPDYPPSGLIDVPEFRLWSNANLPFAIHPQLPNPERVLNALHYLEQNTSIRFTPYNGEPDALVFMPLEGACLSYLGRVGGNQPIYLDAGCGTQEILHEIMHALGFIHEHSRVDRDRYIAVDWNNVQPDKATQFWLTPATWNEALLQRPFDFQSVMMYPPEAFARDRQRPTLYSRSSVAIAPVKTGLSAEDLERVRGLYGGR